MKRVKVLLDVNWVDLARLGRHKTMQLTVLVPIFGYMILFNDWMEKNFKVFGEFPKWKIYCIYYGLTFLAIASLIYTFRCPKIIKLYETAQDYINAEIDYFRGFRIIRVLKYIHLNFTKMDGLLEDVKHYDMENFLKMAGQNNADSSMDMSALASVQVENVAKGQSGARGPRKKDIMHVEYLVLDQSSRWSRMWITGLYYFGFGLLAIPSGWMLLNVILITLKAI